MKISIAHFSTAYFSTEQISIIFYRNLTLGKKISIEVQNKLVLMKIRIF